MAFFRTDDPLKDFDRYDAECAKAEKERYNNLPFCADCNNRIEDDEAYFIGGDWICQDCMSSYLKEVTPE